MRIDLDPRLPQVGNDQDYPKRLNARLYDVFRSIASQLNGISEGKLSASTSATTAAPTTGTWAKGDKIYNTAPAELGTVGSKYVIEGWQCITGGTPGTWVQMRYLTGN